MFESCLRNHQHWEVRSVEFPGVLFYYPCTFFRTRLCAAVPTVGCSCAQKVVVSCFVGCGQGCGFVLFVLLGRVAEKKPPAHRAPEASEFFQI